MGSCPGRSTTALGLNIDRIELNIESIESKIAKIFKRPKNCEDGSNFDDFRTKKIAATQAVSWKIFERMKQTRSSRIIRKIMHFVGIIIKIDIAHVINYYQSGPPRPSDAISIEPNGIPNRPNQTNQKIRVSVFRHFFGLQVSYRDETLTPDRSRAPRLGEKIEKSAK